MASPAWRLLTYEFHSQRHWQATYWSEIPEGRNSDPSTHFKGKTIQVRGVIGLRQGKAQIIVEYVRQIEIVEQE